MGLIESELLRLSVRDGDVVACAVDLEFAHRDPLGICQIGIAPIRRQGDKLVVEERPRFDVCPQPNKDWDLGYQNIHHMKPEDVRGAPKFAEVWAEILRTLDGCDHHEGRKGAGKTWPATR